jgi:hypothetical protein
VTPWLANSSLGRQRGRPRLPRIGSQPQHRIQGVAHYCSVPPRIVWLEGMRYSRLWWFQLSMWAGAFTDGVVENP